MTNDLLNGFPTDFDFRQLEEDFHRQAKLTRQLVDKHPEIGMPTVFIMAGDYAHAEKVDRLFREGKMTFEAAQMMIGSYARFDYVVRWVERGKVKPEDAYALLPNLWSGSDPDDTDPRFLSFWKDAYKANGGIIIDDALPTKWARKRIIRIYRGQDRGFFEQGRLGFAWTTNKNIALKFARGAWARQSNRIGEILCADVQKKDILSFIQGRGEEEVIAAPNTVIVHRKEYV